MLRERKKRNEIEGVLEIWRTGTGTQIVHWGTLAGRKRLVWDSRVRVQDFLTEDTGRGHSLGSEIEG